MFGLRAVAGHASRATVRQPVRRALHVFNGRTGLFDLNLDNAEQVRTELAQLDIAGPTNQQFVARAAPLLVAAALKKDELLSHAAPAANKVYDELAKAIAAASAAAAAQGKPSEPAQGPAPLELSSRVLFALVAFFAKGGQFDKADAAFAALVERKQVDEASSGVLIRENLRNKRLEQAMKVFEQSRGLGVVPSDFTYTAVLTALHTAGDIEGAKACAREMSLRGMSPTLAEGEDTSAWDAANSTLGDFLAELRAEREAEAQEAEEKGVSIAELRQSAAA